METVLKIPNDIYTAGAKIDIDDLSRSLTEHLRKISALRAMVQYYRDREPAIYQAFIEDRISKVLGSVLIEYLKVTHPNTLHCLLTGDTLLLLEQLDKIDYEVKSEFNIFDNHLAFNFTVNDKLCAVCFSGNRCDKPIFLLADGEEVTEVEMLELMK